MSWPPGRSPLARSWRSGQQAIGGESPGIGGQAVSLPVRVVELDEHVLAAEAVEVGDPAGHAASPLRRRLMTFPPSWLALVRALAAKEARSMIS